MKKHIALGICILIFLITGGCSSTMKRSGENGYGGGISSTEKDGKMSPKMRISHSGFWMERNFG